MTLDWKALVDKFEGRTRRERALLAGVVLVCLFSLGDGLALTPLGRKVQAQVSAADQNQADLASVNQQIKALTAEAASLTQTHQQDMARLQKELNDADAKLHSYDGTLVRPEAMDALLEHLLSRRKGIRLLSLQTLPPEPVLQRPKKADDAKAANGSPTPAEAPKGEDQGNIYRHGVELKLVGSYADLLGYLSELEQAPERLLWDQASFKVDAYPKTVLTLRVYTLSLDKVWLKL